MQRCGGKSQHLLAVFGPVLMFNCLCHAARKQLGRYKSKLLKKDRQTNESKAQQPSIRVLQPCQGRDKFFSHWEV